MPAREFQLIDDDFIFMEEANNETIGLPVFKLIRIGPLFSQSMTVSEYGAFENTVTTADSVDGIYSFKTKELSDADFQLQSIFESMNNVVSDSQILIKHSKNDFENSSEVKLATIDLNKNPNFDSPLSPFCEQFKTTLKMQEHHTPGVTSVKVQVIDGQGIWSPAQIGPFAYPEIYYLRPNSAVQTWLIVKPADVKNLLNVLPKKSLFECSNVFCHSDITIGKENLDAAGIQYTVIKQRPGEYLVVKAGVLTQIASCGTAIMDKCAVYLNRCILESRSSYLCCCVDMRAMYDAATWYSFNSLREKEEAEYVQVFKGGYRKRLPNKSILHPLINNQPASSNQMTPDEARQYVQIISSNIASAQLNILPVAETDESQKELNQKRRHADASKKSYKKKKDATPGPSKTHAEANPQSKRLKGLKQGITKKITLRRDKITKYYESNTNADEIVTLKQEIAALEIDQNAIGRLQEMESIINEIGRKDPAAQLAINRLKVQGYFSFDNFRDFFDNSNTKTKKILMEALNARRAKIDYDFWASLVNDYGSWKKVFGQNSNIRRVPVFAHESIADAFKNK